MPYFPPAGGGVLLPNSIDNALLADMADGTIKGRALGAGFGDPTDLTVAQLLAIINSLAGTGAHPRLLQTQTAANSAQLDFTAFDNTKYGSYQLRGSGFMVGTDAAILRLLVSTNGGASYDTSANYPIVSDQLGVTETAITVGTTTTTYFSFTGSLKTGAGNAGFTIDIMPGYGTNGTTIFIAESFAYDSDSRWRRTRCSGAFANQAANAVRMIPSAGVIAQGIACLYGMPK